MNENVNTAYELKPIKILTTVALALHAISIVAVVAITAIQVPLKNLLHMSHSSHGATFVMPSMLFIATVAITFIVHVALAAGFLRNLKNDFASISKLRAFSAISIIFVVVLLPLADSFLRRLDMTLLARIGTNHFTDAIITMNFLYNVLFFRSIALFVLVMAAAVALYYCYLQRGKNLTY